MGEEEDRRGGKAPWTVLTAILKGRLNCHLCFMDDETDSEKLGNTQGPRAKTWQS